MEFKFVVKREWLVLECGILEIDAKTARDARRRVKTILASNDENEEIKWSQVTTTLLKQDVEDIA